MRRLSTRTAFNLKLVPSCTCYVKIHPKQKYRYGAGSEEMEFRAFVAQL